MRKKIDELPFEVDARVAIQLGRESISSSLVAIIELIKNSYDADCEEVDLFFKDINTSQSQLIIKDNGSGMDKNEVIKYWLRIGTNKKRQANKSVIKNRILTGAKGLGRLGIDRLCENLTLQTKKGDSKEVIELDINWTKYEKENIDLSKIKHSLFTNDYKDTLFKKDDQGTILILKKLKDTWNKETLTELKKELTLLISPFEGINDFNININTGLNIHNIDGVVKSEKYLKAADWIVESIINNDNTVSISMTSPIYKKENYKLEKTEWNIFIKNAGNIPRCGPLKFIFYFYLSSKKTEDFKKINFEKPKVIDFLKNNTGVRIYRDNFRVKPYGNPDGNGDWLTLQNRKAKEPAGIGRKTWVVAGHQIIGAVFISRNTNYELIDQTNREGIVEEEAFFDLRKFSLKSIQWFESNRNDFESKRKDPENNINVLKKEVDKGEEKIFEIITKIKNEINNPNKTKEDLSYHLTDLHDNIKDNRVKLNTLETFYENEKNTLANLASIGILAASFGHETAEQSATASTTARELKKSYESGAIELLNQFKDDFYEYLNIIIDSTKFIESFANFTIGNIKTDKRKQSNIDIVKTIRSIFSNMSLSLNLKRIDVDLDNIPDVRSVYIKGFEIDIESIFINLISNSVEALKNVIKKPRLIKVSLTYNIDYVLISFQDSGCGLEKNTKKHIFEATFSTKRDRKGNLIGTGMGLAIVKSFVEDHFSGEISVNEKSELGGAEFLIKLPRSKKGQK